MSLRLSKTLLLYCVAMSITGCSLLQPYQSELGQGNFIRPAQIEQLEVGQTPSQVMFILGTPLLTGENREDRWIYPSFSEDSGYKNLVVLFENGVVSEYIQQ